jgi:hypothetical protein
MKLASIYKKLLIESKLLESAPTEERKIEKGRKLITIECNDSSGDFEKLLRWWESMGNIGHSAVVHCDVEQPESLVKIFCDGDGADRIQKITVKILPTDN